jgi:DNA (cytosine-5)-methyltransferase 1
VKPRLLDLFCGAGGAAMGYSRAGFEVVGVDVRPQPNYPFDFVQEDALHFLDFWMDWLRDGSTCDAIHASPPCQRWSQATPIASRQNHPDLITPLRPLLEATGLPYVIENVRRAPLLNPVVIFGSAVGLPINRPRLFESNFTILVPPKADGQLPKDVRIFRHGTWYLSRFVNVYGTGGGEARERWPEAMGIDWMNRQELGQAIPPAYTELIGHQLLAHIKVTACPT